MTACRSSLPRRGCSSSSSGGSEGACGEVGTEPATQAADMERSRRARNVHACDGPLDTLAARQCVQQAPLDSATPNAGFGYVQYMIEPKDGTVPHCNPASPATASTTFTYCDLKEGDRLFAQLRTMDGKPVTAAAPVVVHRKPQPGFLSPGVGPLFAALLVALAALRRK